MSGSVPPPLPGQAIPPPRAPVGRPPRGTYAGFWRRFMALLVDGLILALSLWLGHLGIRWGHQRVLAGTILDAGGVTAHRLDILAALGYQAFNIGLVLSYFVLFEVSRRAATPGKRLLGFSVAQRSLERAGFFRVLVRNLFKWLSALPLLGGFLLAAFTPRRQALHDLLAACVMVKGRPGSGHAPAPR